MCCSWSAMSDLRPCMTVWRREDWTLSSPKVKLSRFISRIFWRSKTSDRMIDVSPNFETGIPTGASFSFISSKGRHLKSRVIRSRVKRHQLLFQTEKRLHAIGEARKCSYLRAHREQTFCVVTSFK